MGRGSWVMWVMGQLCDGSHGSWVTKDDPFPSLKGIRGKGRGNGEKGREVEEGMGRKGGGRLRHGFWGDRRPCRRSTIGGNLVLSLASFRHFSATVFIEKNFHNGSQSLPPSSRVCCCCLAHWSYHRTLRSIGNNPEACTAYNTGWAKKSEPQMLYT